MFHQIITAFSFNLPEVEIERLHASPDVQVPYDQLVPALFHEQRNPLVQLVDQILREDSKYADLAKNKARPINVGRALFFGSGMTRTSKRLGHQGF